MSALRPLCFAALAAAIAAAVFASHAAAKAKPRAGSIEGTVSFTGKPPPPAAVNRASDPACAKTAAARAVAVTGGKLAGVHVRIKAGTAGKHAAPRKPVTIRQSGCEYRPRVAGAVAGQELVIENGDPTMHNVHAYIGDETWFNRSQPQGTPAIRHRDLGQPGDVFRLECDVHPWMRAFVPITDHPFFDVSGDDGSFSITGVPPGRYTLEAWHPKLGLKTQQVTVGKKPARVSFQFP